MGREAKKYDRLPCIYYIRSVLIGVILMQPVTKCQSHLVKKIYHRCHISFTVKQHSHKGMENPDLDALASNLGFVLKSEQRMLWNHFLMEEMFLVCCLWTLEKAWYFGSFCFGEKQSLQLTKCLFSQTPGNYCYLPAQNQGSKLTFSFGSQLATNRKILVASS